MNDKGFLGYSSGTWIFSLIFGIVFFALMKSCDAPSNEASSSTSNGSTSSAWAYTQQFVKRELKSPSTAEFEFGGHRSVTPLGDGRYSFSSYVDSQNGFGAVTRTKFHGTIRRIDGGWRLEELQLAQLGQPKSVTEELDFLNRHLHYPDLLISFSGSIVAGLFSESPDACTPAGLCPGDLLAHALSLYGAPEIAERETGTFWEYYTSFPCWLQVAPEGDRIASIRVACQP